MNYREGRKTFTKRAVILAIVSKFLQVHPQIF